jgi:hypothetical protein
MLGKLLFAWLLLKGSGGAAPGQGGITKALTLKGLDGRAFKVTFYGDGTRLVQTDKAEFYTRGSKPEAIKVVKGDQAAVSDALRNLPE